MYDILLKQAKVFDYELGLSGVSKDIAIQNGKIALVADHIEPTSDATIVHDLSGYYVSPGWIDGHVHVFGGLAVRDIQSFGVKSGSVCVFDAGDAGLLTIDDYVELKGNSIADVFLMPYMDVAGVPYEGKKLEDLRSIPVLDYIEMIEKNRAHIKAMKFCALGNIGLHNVKIAKVVTETTKIPLYMHVGEIDYYPTTFKITREAFNVLQAGDIATHIYTGDVGMILDEDGKVYQEVLEAKRRGVKFDMSYGTGNFTFEVAEKAMHQDIITDIISSDVNNLSYGRDVNLPAVMGRMLLLGMSLEDVVARVTYYPKQIYDLQGYGTLEAGKSANITVFKVENGDFEFPDCEGFTRKGSQKIVPLFVFKDGLRYECDVEEMNQAGNYKIKYADKANIKEVELDDAERQFVHHLLEKTISAPNMKGETLQRIINSELQQTAIPRKQAVEKLYEILLDKSSIGFTPQIGWILSRMGPVKMKDLYENLLA
jgi:dihydroorotase